MTEDDGKWDKFEEVARKRKREKQISKPAEIIPYPEEDAPGASNSPVLRNRPLATTSGAFRFGAAAKIEREANNRALREWHDGRVRSLIHRIKEELRVGNARISAVAEEHLLVLNKDHLEATSQIRKEAFSSRQKALNDLMQEMVDWVRDIESQNWPRSMIEKRLDQLQVDHDNFADMIMRQFGEES